MRYRLDPGPRWAPAAVLTAIGGLAGVAFAPIPDVVVAGVAFATAAATAATEWGGSVEIRGGVLTVRRRFRRYLTLDVDDIDDILITHRIMPPGWTLATPGYACTVMTIVSTRHAGSFACWPLHAAGPTEHGRLTGVVAAIQREVAVKQVRPRSLPAIRDYIGVADLLDEIAPVVNRTYRVAKEPDWARVKLGAVNS